jgi:hypothetical protein
MEKKKNVSTRICAVMITENKCIYGHTGILLLQLLGFWAAPSIPVDILFVPLAIGWFKKEVCEGFLVIMQINSHNTRFGSLGLVNALFFHISPFLK